MTTQEILALSEALSMLDEATHAKVLGIFMKSLQSIKVAELDNLYLKLSKNK